MPKRPITRVPAHKPWTLSSDGKGHVSVVLGSSYGTCPPAADGTSGMGMAEAVDDKDGPPLDFVAFLRVLVEHGGDLVTAAATGCMGVIHKRNAMRVLYPVVCLRCGVGIGEPCIDRGDDFLSQCATHDIRVQWGAAP